MQLECLTGGERLADLEKSVNENPALRQPTMTKILSKPSQLDPSTNNLTEAKLSLEDISELQKALSTLMETV